MGQFRTKARDFLEQGWGMFRRAGIASCQALRCFWPRCDAMKTGPQSVSQLPLLLALTLLALGTPRSSAAESTPSLLEARRGFQTRLLRKEAMGEPADQPPAGAFQL